MLDKLRKALGKKVIIEFSDGEIYKGTLLQNVHEFQEVPDEFDVVSADGLHYSFGWASVRDIHSFDFA